MAEKIKEEEEKKQSKLGEALEEEGYTGISKYFMAYGLGFDGTADKFMENKKKREQEKIDEVNKKAKEIKDADEEKYTKTNAIFDDIAKHKEEGISKKIEIMSSPKFVTPEERASAFNSYQNTYKQKLEMLTVRASQQMEGVQSGSVLTNLGDTANAVLSNAAPMSNYQKLTIGDKSIFVDDKSYEAAMENPNQYGIGKDGNLYALDQDGKMTNQKVAEGKNFNGLPNEDKDSLVKTWDSEKNAYVYTKKELGATVYDKPADEGSKYGKTPIDAINNETGKLEQVTQEDYFGNKSKYTIPTSSKTELVVVTDKDGNEVAKGLVSEDKLLEYTNKGFSVSKQYDSNTSGSNKKSKRENFIIYNRNGNPIKAGYMKEEEAIKIAEENNGSVENAAKGGVADANEIINKSKKRNAQSKFKIAQTNRTIDKAIDLISANPNATSGWGALLSVVPSTKSKDLSNLISELKANVSFSTLTNMRESSPTGGALGSVTEGELTLLGNSQSAFEQSQDSESLKEALSILKYNFNAAINGGDYKDPETGEVISRDDVVSAEKDGNKPVAKAGDYDVYQDEKGYYVIVDGKKKYQNK